MDELHWLPIPLATGEVMPGRAGGVPVRRISVTVETQDGATETVELAYARGGWRMPASEGWNV